MDSGASGKPSALEKAGPFTEMEHTFNSLEEARNWLGIDETHDTSGEG
jgi:hypothetical protein